MNRMLQLQRVLRVIALLSLLAVCGAIGYLFVTDDPAVGTLVVIGPLAVTVLALALDLLIHVVGVVRSAAAGDSEVTDTYLDRFRRTNFYMAFLFVSVLAIFVALDVYLEQNSNEPLDTFRGFLELGIYMFGGTGIFVLNAAVFGAIWYGLRQQSREAALAGIGVWGLVAVSGVVNLRESGAGIGILLAGVMGLYYGILALKSTEMQYLGETGGQEGVAEPNPQGGRDAGAEQPPQGGREAETGPTPQGGHGGRVGPTQPTDQTTAGTSRQQPQGTTNASSSAGHAPSRSTSPDQRQPPSQRTQPGRAPGPVDSNDSIYHDAGDAEERGEAGQAGQAGNAEDTGDTGNADSDLYYTPGEETASEAEAPESEAPERDIDSESPPTDGQDTENDRSGDETAESRDPRSEE